MSSVVSVLDLHCLPVSDKKDAYMVSKCLHDGGSCLRLTDDIDPKL